MSDSTATGPDPLAPVRRALLDRAAADAATAVAQAEAEAAATLAQARVQAEEILARAREQGEADAAVMLAGERARAARQARLLVLSARAQAHNDLRGQARAAAAGLREDASYAGLVAGLTARVHRELGEDAFVQELEQGGVVGRAGDRTMTLSLPDLAEDVVDRLGAELEWLWSG